MESPAPLEKYRQVQKNIEELCSRRVQHVLANKCTSDERALHLSEKECVWYFHVRHIFRNSISSVYWARYMLICRYTKGQHGPHTLQHVVCTGSTTMPCLMMPLQYTLQENMRSVYWRQTFTDIHIFLIWNIDLVSDHILCFRVLPVVCSVLEACILQACLTEDSLTSDRECC